MPRYLHDRGYGSNMANFGASINIIRDNVPNKVIFSVK